MTSSSTRKTELPGGRVAVIKTILALPNGGGSQINPAGAILTLNAGLETAFEIVGLGDNCDPALIKTRGWTGFHAGTL
jgi:hypothetical protein